MRCPECGHPKSRVTDSRMSGQFRRRIHRCANGHTFPTLEGVVGKQPFLSADDRRIIRRAIDRIVAALGIPPSNNR